MEIKFTTWRNCGLGLMICPPLQQAGILFFIWSIVFIWGDWIPDQDGAMEMTHSTAGDTK